ncbi:MAG: hypothetical protein AB8C02_08980 [Halioglobus sp.]
MQSQLQQEYGEAFAGLIAHRVSSALEAGDLLSVSASLQRFVEMSAAQRISLTDVEGKTIGQAGKNSDSSLQRYSAPVRIESDIAGTLVIELGTQGADSAQQQFSLSLLGLALLLSLTVYIAARMLGQTLGNRLLALARTLRLEEEDQQTHPTNEIALLEKRIAALPMDLLRTRSEPVPQEENYETTAVLYLSLASLADYVETLDEQSLQRYTDRLHQLVFAAAGFYAGDLQVVRQFGLAVFFSEQNTAGSAAFRAASCAWLVRAAGKTLEEKNVGSMGLSLNISMAIAQSELGVGNANDIYPGLYMQHTLDELQAICDSRPPHILLSAAANNDVDVSSRVQTQASEPGDHSFIEGFHGQYRDLLERQAQLILNRLTDPTRLSL